MSARVALAGALLVTLVIGLVVGGAPARGRPARQPPLDVSCTACFVIDDADRILWARAAHTRLPNASTTKMVTALEVVDRAGLDETVTVSAAAGSVGGGGLDLSPGDRMSVHDLLYALLLSSSNEAAAALAEHVGGTQEDFVADMNRRARALGARDTHFVNPHGLDATGHYSTAADLARIGAAVLAQPLLAEIVATPSAEIQTPRGPEVEENRNLLLDSYPGAIGIKTGRTLGAGNVLVAAARRGDRTIIAVAMHSADAIADDRVLLDYGFVRARRLDRPRSTTVLGARTSIGALIFDPSGVVEVVAGAPVTIDLPSDAGALDYLFQPGDVSPPFTPGQRIGTVTISSDGEQVAQVDAVVADAVADTSGSFGANVLGAVIEAVATVVAAVT